MGYLQKRLGLLFLSGITLVSTSVLAEPITPLLNKISYQVAVEKWASTSTANVTVSVDAVLDKIGLGNINNYVLKNMNGLANSKDWHITQYTRSQDKSGLETIHIEAQARIPTTDLAAIRDKAKAISKTGETYTVANIDFSPSLEEIENTHAIARSTVYYWAKQEIANLTQAYPGQEYFLYSIDFAPQSQTPGPFAKVTMAEAAPAADQSPMSVNAKITDNAAVVIASVTPDIKK